MSKRYVCIHGHFYQPPRENAWLEAVEAQDSARPNHDWNERITSECYGPNARARQLDHEGWIVDIVCNYASISFNFGPTLLAWLEQQAPAVYEQIVKADRQSRERFNGHGSAMAQAYNHMILPLSNERDLRTQVRWGIRDFEHRFGRAPEGMWLPETAANTPTLEVLAEQDVRFTVLAPRQAARLRPLTGGDWSEAKGGIDPSRAYEYRLPSGRSIALFFYDGPISQGVAFEGLLHSGEGFAKRIMGGFDPSRTWPQLAHIATDGESYGHHHAHGDMALAAALGYLSRQPDVTLTNYGEFLERHPPTHEVQIVENSSWSCVHGVERWKADCACCSGAHPEWHQRWRAPLREALDWLRDSVAPLYEQNTATLVRDPWAARDAYIAVILDRSPESLQNFLTAHQSHSLSDGERATLLKLLEVQRHAMLMYTSCGWFFDDIAGIETIQVIQYAGRVVQLMREIAGVDFETEFLSRLEKAQGNIPTRPNGREVYLQCVRPAMVDLLRVGAHYAISSLFENYADSARILCYNVYREDATTASAGRARFLVGRARVESRITTESMQVSYGVLHLGDHTLNCGIRAYQGPEPYAEVVRDAQEAFDRADFAQVLRVIDRAFDKANYSIASLFRDAQHKLVRRILGSTLQQIDASYRQIYEFHAPLVRFLRQLDLIVPRRLEVPASFVLNDALAEALSASPLDSVRIEQLLAEAKSHGVPLDDRNLAFAMESSLLGLTETIDETSTADDLAILRRAVQLVDALPFVVNLWRTQDAGHQWLGNLLPEMHKKSEAGDREAARWVDEFKTLAQCLRIRMP